MGGHSAPNSIAVAKLLMESLRKSKTAQTSDRLNAGIPIFKPFFYYFCMMHMNI